MKMGVQTYSFLACSPATPGEENPHGPRHHMLPQSGVPRQRTNRPGSHSPPRVQGPALQVYGVPQDVQRHDRHRMVSPRTSAETVSLVVTLMAHRCPRPAIVVAFGDDERTVACWLARAGAQGQAVPAQLVEPPRALGQVQADAIRVKTPGGLVGRALALIVSPRLWLAGAVSPHRDLARMGRLREQVRRCARPRPLLVGTDGWCSSVRAMRATCRDPERTGSPWTAPAAAMASGLHRTGRHTRCTPACGRR